MEWFFFLKFNHFPVATWDLYFSLKRISGVTKAGPTHHPLNGICIIDESFSHAARGLRGGGRKATVIRFVIEAAAEWLRVRRQQQQLPRREVNLLDFELILIEISRRRNVVIWDWAVEEKKSVGVQTADGPDEMMEDEPIDFA